MSNDSKGKTKNGGPKKIVKRSKGNKSSKSKEAKNYDEPKYYTPDRLACLFFGHPQGFRIRVNRRSGRTVYRDEKCPGHVWIFYTKPEN